MELRQFRHVYTLWDQPTCVLHHSTREVTISPSSRDAVLAVLAAEEKMILNTLEMLGVDPPEKERT